MGYLRGPFEQLCTENEKDLSEYDDHRRHVALPYKLVLATSP